MKVNKTLIDMTFKCSSRFYPLLLLSTIVELPDRPPLPPRKAYGTLELQELSTLFGMLQYISVHPNGIKMDQPISMEKLGQVFLFLNSELAETYYLTKWSFLWQSGQAL
jgi:hypothetical protein